MNKTKTNVNKPAFPAKVNAMGYSDGLSKKELVATLVLSNMLSFTDGEANIASAVQVSVKAAEALLAALESSNS